MFMNGTDNTNTKNRAIATNTKCYCCDAPAVGFRVYDDAENKPAAPACSRHATIKLPATKRAKPAKRQCVNGCDQRTDSRQCMQCVTEAVRKLNIRRARSRSGAPAAWLAAD